MSFPMLPFTQGISFTNTNVIAIAKAICQVEFQKLNNKLGY